MIAVVTAIACSGKRPANLGISDAQLAPCPPSPNCVSSDAADSAHQLEAFSLSAPPEDAWHVIREEVASLPRTTVVEQTSEYLHAQCASALFGFVDDLELHLRASDNVVAIRSASRVGYSDLGVNRRRAEQLREALRIRGVVR